MKVSYNRLKDILNFDATAEECAGYLTNCGLEVEGMEPYESVRGGLKGIVIGEVMSCRPHPDSDHLHITEVDVGGANPLHIVCGAPNVAAGQKVAVATVGAVLYNDDKPYTIRKSKLRGEISEGMICAEDEIGVGSSHDGIMVLKTDARPGTPASEYFKVTSDTIFEIGLTPNRSDAISNYGVARDLYAALSLNKRKCSPLIMPNVRDIKPLAKASITIDVTVENRKDCPRYTGLVLDNVRIGDSPEWLQSRLKAVGVRPVNNIVDITQYIMLEFGQPMHAFDADKIKGNRVIVKNLPEGTPFVTLDGNEVRLSAEDLMICNAEEGMCIAGVYGGLHSGVTAHTTRVFLESAYFNPTAVRRTAKRHGLKTEASFRYERGCDPSITVYAIKRAAELAMDIAGCDPISDIMDFYPEKIEPASICLFYNDFYRVAGKKIDKHTISKILLMLGMEVHTATGDQLLVTVPQNKADVTRPIDLIEEILRIYGYQNIDVAGNLSYRLPEFFPEDREGAMRANISKYLSDIGFYEVMNNSLTKAAYAAEFDFIDENETVRLLNPLSGDMGVLRQTLLFQGLENIVRNTNNRNPDLRLFEFGKSYAVNTCASKEDDVTARYREKPEFALFVTGKDGADQWDRKAGDLDLFYLKNVVENVLLKENFPLAKCRIEADMAKGMFSDGLSYSIAGDEAVRIGRLHPGITASFGLKKPVCYAEVSLPVVVKYGRRDISYAQLAAFPAVRRDLALVVRREVTYAQLEAIGRKYGSKLVKDIMLFDVYEGDGIAPGMKSYALTFVLQDPDKTLTDGEISRAMNKLVEAYRREAGAELRS